MSRKTCDCQCGCNGRGDPRQMVPVRLLEAADNDGRSSYQRGRSWLVLKACAAPFKIELHNERVVREACQKWRVMPLWQRWLHWRLVGATCDLWKVTLLRRSGDEEAEKVARETWRALMWPRWAQKRGGK